MARPLAGTCPVGNAEGYRQTPVRKRCQASHGFGWPEAWPAPSPLETRTDTDQRRSEIDDSLPTGSVGQKPGRHLGRWKRGGIQTNVVPKKMSGFPRVRLARSLAGTCAVGNVPGFRTTPVRTRCQSPHGFGGQEAWPAPGPLETRSDTDKRRSETDVRLPTGSVGQKPGRHRGRWKRGGIQTNAGPKEMQGSPTGSVGQKPGRHLGG